MHRPTLAIQPYHYIKELLEEDNLQLSTKKTGFIASNVEAKRMLQAQLPQGGPVVRDVMRDLGVDCTAGRLRRIMTMKNRRKKAGCKTRKLHYFEDTTKGSEIEALQRGRHQLGTPGNGPGTTNQAPHQLNNGSADGLAAHRKHGHHL